MANPWDNGKKSDPATAEELDKIQSAARVNPVDATIVHVVDGVATQVDLDDLPPEIRREVMKRIAREFIDSAYTPEQTARDARIDAAIMKMDAEELRARIGGLMGLINGVLCSLAPCNRDTISVERVYRTIGQQLDNRVFPIDE